MNPQLTERLICPRCGPGFGLVLRADDVDHGSVLRGFLGCSNCRVLYPVEKGVADLRLQPRSRSRARGPAPPPARGFSERDTLRIAALLGVAEGPAHIAVAGSIAGAAAAIGALLPGVDVVALAPRFDSSPPSGASHLLVSERVPLKSGSLAGIALAGPWAELLLNEAVRSIARAGRLVLLDASETNEQDLCSHNLTVLASEPGTLVGRLA